MQNPTDFLTNSREDKLVGVIDSLRKSGKGQYYELLKPICQDDFTWSEIEISEVIENAIQAGKIREVVSNEKVAYRIIKDTTIRDPVENRGMQTVEIGSIDDDDYVELKKHMWDELCSIKSIIQENEQPMSPKARFFDTPSVLRKCTLIETYVSTLVTHVTIY